MITKPKSKRCIVAAVYSCLILVTTSQICFAGAQSNPLINKQAPKLDVAEWVKGKPTTLDKLKGKVVLLYFWAQGDTASLEKFPALVRFHKKYARDGLVRFHKKYARDGLVIITSLHKESLLVQSSDTINLSDIPFRVAIDSPATESAEIEVQGKGKTIAAYGVTSLPTHVLIGKDGKIQSFGEQLLEKRINLLLYGHTRNLSTEPPSQDEALNKARKEFMAIAIGAGLLILVGAFVVIKRRLGSF
ncbi:MAG: TlpA disulfide reductase family protein [Planctomycetota bacterium]|jgi:thiol-disulfide isomerase/thioredoxin